MSSRFAQLKKHKAARIAGAVLLGSFVLVLLIQVVLSVMWGRGLEKKLAELRKRGEPTTLAELMPAPVSPEDNAAIIYERAFAAMTLYKGKHSRSPIGRKYYGDPLTDYFWSRTTPEERAKLLPELRRIVSENDTALKLAEQAAARPRCIFPVDWTKGIDADTSHHRDLHKLVRLVCARAVVRAKGGRMNDAVDDLVLALKVARTTEGEPSIWSFVRETIDIRQVMGCLQQVASTHALSPRQAADVYDALSGIPLQKAMMHSLRGERALESWIYRCARKDILGFYESHFIGFASGYGPLPLSKLGALEKGKRTLVNHLWRPLSYREQRMSLVSWDQRMPILKRPYREIISEKLPYRITHQPKLTYLYGILSAASSNLPNTRDAAKAEIGLAQTAMALRTYKDYTGRYPESLEQLKKRVNWKLPEDPFSGKPFVYKQLNKGRGFKLYSINSDLNDNGGFTYEQIKSMSMGPNATDIVWESRN